MAANKYKVGDWVTAEPWQSSSYGAHERVFEIGSIEKNGTYGLKCTDGAIVRNQYYDDDFLILVPERKPANIVVTETKTMIRNGRYGCWDIVNPKSESNPQMIRIRLHPNPAFIGFEIGDLRYAAELFTALADALEEQNK